MMSEKLCKDCIHVLDVHSEFYWECMRKSNKNLVNGSFDHPRAAYERSGNFIESYIMGSCGKRGRFFVRKKEVK